jgi:CheY-like chemotaxis protein
MLAMNTNNGNAQQATEKVSILVVDDTPENIDVLDGILNPEYKILVALNGETAIKLAIKHKPNLILLDVMMPVMDGYQACFELKANPETKNIPIIFVTAKADVESELHGFKLGAVDYITKPISPPIVLARIKTHLRLQQLMVQLAKDKETIAAANKQLLHDQEMAKAISDKMMKKGCLDLINAKFRLKPMEVFAGDLLLATIGPDGSVYILIGDFTGHGLTASIGVLPTTNIFYAMSNKGYSLSSIMIELNSTLKASLPTGMFCAACAVHIDVTNGVLNVWNGWNPEAWVVDAAGTVVRSFKSTHMPLGLQKREKFNPNPEIFILPEDARLLLYTDGVVEAKNAAGEMFGDTRVLDVFKTHKDIGTAFEQIITRLEAHMVGTQQGDDITMIEYHYQKPFDDKSKNKTD